jgi:hypothetical protein
MSNLNSRAKRSAPKAVTNHEGEVQTNLSAKQALAAIVSTSFIQPTYYASKQAGLKELKSTVGKIVKSDPEFVLKTAAYARNVLNMRSVSVALLVEAAKHKQAKPLVRKFTPKVLMRADELTDAISFHLDNYGKPIPNSLKRGVADSFNNFSKYQLTKYQRKRNKVTLADVIKLTWPKLPSELFDGLINGTIEAPKTRETVLSANDGRSKTEKLDDVIPNMGYMALLRNVVAAIEAGVSENSFEHMISVLSNKKAVLGSKQLPFRFLSAYDEVKALSKATGKTKEFLLRVKRALKAILKAAEISTGNLDIKGRTLYIVDDSGSMFSGISGESKRTCAEIATLLAVAGAKYSELSDVWLFSDTVRVADIRLESHWLTEAERLRKSFRGAGTYFNEAMAKLVQSKEQYDNIVVLSDMQVYTRASIGYFGVPHTRNASPDTYWKLYLNKYPDSKMYVFDLRGYNRGQPFKKDGSVHLISGWSEKVLDMIGKDTNIVEEIESYDPFAE